MFSGNHKISARQLYRNYAAGLISLSALLPPLVMNRENPAGIGISLVFLGIYLAWSAAVPRPRSDMAKALCYAHYWILGTLTAHMTGLLVQEFLLTDASLWIILGWFYLFCYYNLYKGLECRIRVSEILFPFFLFLLLLLSVLMYGEVEPGRIRELTLHLDRDQLLLGYGLFCWLGAVQSLWHLHGQVGDEQVWKKTVWRIWLTGGIVVPAWSLFSYCIYGNAGHTGLTFPLASAMTLAHFPGNVIGRLDALFIFVWVIGLFLLCSSLFAPIVDGEPDTRRKYLLFALLTASFALALQPEFMDWGQKLLYFVSAPIQILLLLWHSMGKRGRKVLTAGSLLLLPLFLSGCSAQELENQSRVTAVSVDRGENADYFLTFGFGTTEEEGEEPFETEASSLEEAKELYWKTCQKRMDFNHLKNFYFSREVLGGEDFPVLLEEIQIHGEYSRGTLAYATEGEAAGEAEKREQPREGMPVHRLLNAWYNQEVCEIPVITADGRYEGTIPWQY
ncbi:MAG: GerAB/ArcD/ProY family transporter [Clostridiales bacterium]|nr:GerAB/ArcD/ProY family transporter [Clostridiales bacterium]